MRRICWPLVAFCVLCCQLAAQEQLSIRVDTENTSEIAIGQLAKLEVVTDAQGPATYVWTLDSPPPNYDLKEWTLNDGRMVVFSSGTPGTYQFQLVVATNVGADKPPSVKVVTHVLTVKGSVPKPPDPQPEDPDEPDEPPSFGLADLVAASVAELVKADGKQATAQKLGLGYLSVVAKIESGGLTTVDAVQNALKSANAAVLTDEEKQAWAEWGGAVSGHLTTLRNSGKIVSVADYARAYKEIAEGLSRVK